jgi:hypothetical protein
MNALERRITDALRGRGEGLVMTTQDIDRLEQQFAERIMADRKERRGAIWQAAVAACALTGIVLGVLALRNDSQPPSPISPTEIAPTQRTTSVFAGLWRIDSGVAKGALWLITEDGAASGNGNADELFTGSPQWTVVPGPGGLTLTKVDTPACQLTWSVSLETEGRMRVTVTRAGPTCPDPFGKVADFTRLSPASSAGARIRSFWPTIAPEVVTDPTKLAGTWLLSGTGRVLTVRAPNPDLGVGWEGTSRYSLRDLGNAAALETGIVRWQQDGWTIVFDPDEGDCTTVYESTTSRTSTLVGTLAVGSCGRFGGATDTWIRLADK